MSHCTCIEKRPRPVGWLVGLGVRPSVCPKGTKTERVPLRAMNESHLFYNGTTGQRDNGTDDDDAGAGAAAAAALRVLLSDADGWTGSFHRGILRVNGIRRRR